MNIDMNYNNRMARAVASIMMPLLFLGCDSLPEDNRRVSEIMGEGLNMERYEPYYPTGPSRVDSYLYTPGRRRLPVRHRRAPGPRCPGCPR